MKFKIAKCAELSLAPAFILMVFFHELYQDAIVTKVIFFLNAAFLYLLASIMIVISIKEQLKIFKLLKSNNTAYCMGKTRYISVAKRYTLLPMTTIQYNIHNKIYNFKTDVIPDYIGKQENIPIIYNKLDYSHATINNKFNKYFFHPLRIVASLMLYIVGLTLVEIG